MGGWGIGLNIQALILFDPHYGSYQRRARGEDQRPEGEAQRISPLKTIITRLTKNNSQNIDPH